jgi:hypothetical protein
MDELNKFREIQSAVDQLLNIKSIAKRKKKSDNDKKRETFFYTINTIEELNIRQNLLYADLKVDFSSYDERFYQIIDSMMHLAFGKQCTDLIGFYLYDRINPDGTMNPILTEDGRELFLNDPYELWDLMRLVNPKIIE